MVFPDALVEEAREELAPIADQFFNEAGRSTAKIAERLDRLVGERVRLRDELEAIRNESRDALETIATESRDRSAR